MRWAAEWDSNFRQRRAAVRHRRRCTLMRRSLVVTTNLPFAQWSQVFRKRPANHTCNPTERVVKMYAMAQEVAHGDDASAAALASALPKVVA
jgi:hypothetical protein